jgi:hypothetical protein
MSLETAQRSANSFTLRRRKEEEEDDDYVEDKSNVTHDTTIHA